MKLTKEELGILRAMIEGGFLAREPLRLADWGKEVDPILFCDDNGEPVFYDGFHECEHLAFRALKGAGCIESQYSRGGVHFWSVTKDGKKAWEAHKAACESEIGSAE